MLILITTRFNFFYLIFLINGSLGVSVVFQED